MTLYGSLKYKNGYCHVFAIALQRVFGYQIAYLEDKGAMTYNDKMMKIWPYCPHVFAVKKGYIIDVLGVRKPSTMIRNAGKFNIKRPEIHITDTRFLYNTSYFKENYEPITEPAIKDAIAFILKHREMYRV